MTTRADRPIAAQAEPLAMEAARPERPPFAPMSRRLHLLELRFPLEGAVYLLMQPLLRILHVQSHRHAVLVLPGGMGGDGSTLLLRWGIGNLGYSAHGWGQGRNMGLTEQMLTGLRARVDELHALFDARITVIGWSLGGLYARMLARDKPEKIRQVITLGSPFRMVETDQFAHNMIGRGRWEKMVATHAKELDLLRVHEHHRPPITVPTTAIYSRRDGFAPWQLSLDEVGPDAPNPRAENVEICGTHTGLSTNIVALAVVLDRLAQAEGQWKPFKPSARLRGFYPPAATWTHPAKSPTTQTIPSRQVTSAARDRTKETPP